MRFPGMAKRHNIRQKYGIKLNVIEVTPDELYSKEVLELTNRTRRLRHHPVQLSVDRGLRALYPAAG